MPDEASTPPADPPPQQATDGQSTQAPPSEPVSAPVIEPPKSEDTSGQATPPPEAAAPAPEPNTPAEPEISIPEPAPESAASTPPPEPMPEPEQPQPVSNQNSSEAKQPSQTQATTTVIRPHGDPEEQQAVNGARLAVANAKIQEAKRKKLDKIMARLSEKGKITNDEVEKLLHVSDATATRYLQALEKENKIKQTGSTGTGVFYEPR